MLRRKLFLVAVSVLLIGLFTLGAQAQTPKYGGTFDYALDRDVGSIDPHSAHSVQRINVGLMMFDQLFTFDTTGQVVPNLVESYEISPDGLVYTFHLRKGVKFHTGREMTAQDVKFSFERLSDPRTQALGYAELNSVLGKQEFSNGEAAEITGIRVIDDYTVEIELVAPDATFTRKLAKVYTSIVGYEGIGENMEFITPVGTGPFKYVEYVPNQHLILERNPDYWQEGLPYLDSDVFRIMSDPNSRFAALQSGDIDLIGVALQPEQFIQLQANPDLRGTEGTATTEITMAMNNTREPFSNPLVRQAITHAIDKEAIVNGAFFGLGTIIGSHMSPAEPYYVDLSNTYAYDPERARELLAEAGYADGFTIQFELPEPYNTERRTGEVIAQQLAQVGINAELSVVEWTTWINRILLGGDYDMTIIGHSEPRDIGVYGNPDYYYHYDNPRVVELLAEAEAAATTEESNAKFQEIATIIAEDAVNVWVFSAPYLVAARADVHGFWTDQPTPSINVTEVYRAE